MLSHTYPLGCSSGYIMFTTGVRDWHETSPAIKRVVKLSHCLCHITRQTFTISYLTTGPVES